MMRIAYGDVARLQNPSASSELSAYPALNAIHPHLSRKWRPSNPEMQWIQFDAGFGMTLTADCAAIAGHNLSGLAESFCDRGDCESATPPMVRGETVPVTFNATFLPDATQFYAGAQSYRFTKTVAAGTDAYVNLADTALTTDMHGFLPGQTVTKRYRLRIPSGGILGSEIVLSLRDYAGGAWELTTQVAQDIYDAWQEVTVTRTLRAGATGFFPRIFCNATAALNEYFNVDEIEIDKVPAVRIMANDTNDWTAPALSQAFGSGDPMMTFFPSTAKRFWRFEIDDPGNPNGYIQIGRVMLCTLWEGETIDRGFKIEVEDSTVVSRSYTGQLFTDLGVQQRVYSMSLGTMLNATKESLHAVLRAVGQHDPVVVFPGDGIDPLYATASKQTSFTEAGGWGWTDDALQFREAL